MFDDSENISKSAEDNVDRTDQSNVRFTVGSEHIGKAPGPNSPSKIRRFDEVNSTLAPERTYFQEETKTKRKDWAVILIDGRGKQSAEIFKTSVDVWRCDIGLGK